MLIEACGYKMTFVVFGVGAILGALLAGVLWNARPAAASSSTTSRR